MKTGVLLVQGLVCFVSCVRLILGSIHIPFHPSCHGVFGRQNFTGRFWDSFSGELRFTYFGICSEVETVCFGLECWGVAVVHGGEAHVLIAGDEVI